MKLTIFSRLVIGYFILFILVIGVSFYSIVQLDKVKNATHKIILVDNPLSDLHKKLANALLEETRHEKKYLILRDSALYESYLAAKKDFDQFLDQALSLSDSPEGRELLIKVHQLHSHYSQLIDQEAVFVTKGEHYPKKQYEKDKEKITDEILSGLSKLKLITENRIFSKIRDLGMHGEKARKAAITITVASLLIGLVLSVFITRSITHPLSRMKKRTAAIAKGNFEADLNISSPPEIGELAQAFNFMCHKLREVDRMKSDFFSVMSHELRTPLTSIREGTNLMLEGLGGEVTGKQKKLLTIIEEESNRLIELVNSLLDLSKIEAGMVEYNFSKADLMRLIQKTIHEILPLAEAKQIAVVKRIHDLPHVKVDAERILQVLRNLIGNALKFTPRGGQIRISARKFKTWVAVSVSDTGSGIPKDQLGEIFDKFKQAAFRDSQTLKGTGLGLAITRHIIDSHGGKIWVRSTFGEGSTFFFLLPL